MAALRSLIPPRVARSLEALHVLDQPVQDSLFMERIQRIQAQVTAAYLLRDLVLRVDAVDLTDPVQREAADRLDLMFFANTAYDNNVIDIHEWRCFKVINEWANEAKHQLRFRSRARF